MSPQAGLRARKKAAARRHIASCAAELFASDGYDNVTVAQVAIRAEVSQQTVYNYFATKEQLVLDQEDELRDLLVDAVRSRPPGTTPAESLRGPALAFVASVASMSTEQVAGGLGGLALSSPTVRRLALEMTERTAEAVACALAAADSTPVAPVHRLRAVSLAWVVHLVTDEVGRRARAGLPPATIAAEVALVVEMLIDDLVAQGR